ncbi:MAG: Molybdopterin oxidoreductase iron-sulfur binding subunit [Anaerolineae bacterium]|jgi:molybdopterin-containing oxidoreductase family iron-sulfur binding subunit|nr:MAG: Molybdopterin oxidoreductase iron-sulfur binding subunit [Anaerolineae bacterium]
MSEAQGASLLSKVASEVFAGVIAPALENAPLIQAAEDDVLAQEDVLVRMERELQRALQKTPAERRWVMVIDLRRCIGCHACTIACVAENKLPPGVVYRPVLTEEIGRYPHVTYRFLPKPCMQCENAPCTPVCPVHATYTNEEGVIVVDYDQCIGCRACISACPYASRTFDFGLNYTDHTVDRLAMLVGSTEAGKYETAGAAFEYGERRERKHEQSPIGNVRKCHFCLHRIKEGILPACTTTCIGRATFFGDANDPDSLVSELIAKPNVMRLKEELGTEPRVYYLV